MSDRLFVPNSHIVTTKIFHIISDLLYFSEPITAHGTSLRTFDLKGPKKIILNVFKNIDDLIPRSIDM